MFATELMQSFFSAADFGKGMEKLSNNEQQIYGIWNVMQLKVDFKCKGIIPLLFENQAGKALIFNAYSTPTPQLCHRLGRPSCSDFVQQAFMEDNIWIKKY